MVINSLRIASRKIDKNDVDLSPKFKLKYISKRRISRIFESIEDDDRIKDKPTEIFIKNGEEPYFDYNFFYITDYPHGVFEGSILLASSNGSCVVITSTLEELIARKFSNGIEVIIQKPGETAETTAERSFRFLTNRKVGLDFSKTTQSEFIWFKKRLRPKSIVDISSCLQKTRAVKDELEIARITEAAQIASKTFSEIRKQVKRGVQERILAASVNYSMERHGSKGTAFETILSSGPNSAEPHYFSGERKVRDGDNLLLDYGAKIRRYNSDISRTLFCGKASKTMREVYDIVLRAQTEAIDKIVPGVLASEVDSTARKVIDSSPYKGRFTHSLGHSIGLAVHDGFGLNQRNRQPLEKNMVFTVEPGIYLPGRGGVRIEDDIVVTSGKPRILTNATRELIEF
jgi:Xaa-Pro dipeptidase